MTVANLTSRDGKPIRARVMESMITELEGFDFGVVTNSLTELKSVEGVPSGTFNSYSKDPQIQARRFEVAYKRYVYGSAETIAALKAGEDGA